MNALKLTFFKWHLTASLTAVITIGFMCQMLWFPAPFLLLDGTWIALLILAGVDITVGPLLTLLLVSSKKTKRAIVFDMVVILAVQISALTYGLVQIEQQRVVALVHFNNVFHLVTKQSVSGTDFDQNELATYHGMKYGMIDDSKAFDHYKGSSKPILYETNLYSSLTSLAIKLKTFPADKVPDIIKNTYGDSFTFKALAGKKRNAIVVLKEKSNVAEMNIINIILLPK